MKRIYSVLLFLCCLSTISVSYALTHKVAGDKIDLSGNLPDGKQKSLIAPIGALLAGQSIEVSFYSNLGTITVFIYDETDDIVYMQSTSTYSGLQISIDITSFDSGVYTIEFVNAQGQYLSGSFEI